MDINSIASKVFIAPNTIQDWVTFALIVLFALLVRTLIAKGLTKLLFRFFQRKEKEEIGFQKLFDLVRKPWNLLLFFIALSIAGNYLHWPTAWKLAQKEEFGVIMISTKLVALMIGIAITWLLLRITDFFGLILLHRASKTESTADDQLVPFLREAIKVIIVILAIFIMLGSIFDMNIASLIAGLGIGGIAVALAAKESLENLIGSFTVFLDKPFSVGENILLPNNQVGTIDRIGFRSTRIRAEDSTYITVPNRKMVENEIYNVSKRNSRRVITTIGVTYSTSPEKIKSVMDDLRNYIDSREDLVREEGRVSLFNFGASSIDIQLIYYIKLIDFSEHLLVREEVNFKIMEIMHRHGVSFAYPTTTVRLEQQ